MCKATLHSCADSAEHKDTWPVGCSAHHPMSSGGWRMGEGDPHGTTCASHQPGGLFKRIGVTSLYQSMPVSSLVPRYSFIYNFPSEDSDIYLA